ncbi:WD domain, G-beta repeat protein [Oesophagostomum dentatum]|uniref:WD domain, G-beta repeat protein n=1 Tax=Oesophagostomum dentatum TaxID=61180 RepID=A0A0B1SDY2_OESDE|nr:WD domain, G-beta repeat protein [Oesophagostomum dentatum]
MMNAELLERNFGVQFPEELDGTLDLQTWTAHALPVSSLSWSRNGRKLLTASADTTVAVWNVIEGSCLHRLKYSAMVTSAVFNPRNDNQVLVLQLNYPPCLDELEPRSQRIITNDIPGAVEDGVSAIAFDRRANYLITGTNKVFNLTLFEYMTFFSKRNSMELWSTLQFLQVRAFFA